MINETIDVLNRRLKDQYGIDTESDRPLWRIVWSEDQLEKRLVTTTKDGFHLLTPIVEEVPKYKQYIQNKYVLENLVVVPEFQRMELADVKTSYEPLYVFEDKRGNPLPPKWEACVFIIRTVMAAKGHASMAKYKEGLLDKNDREGTMARVNKIESELFGNETTTTDALAHKTGVTVPHNFEPSN